MDRSHLYIRRKIVNLPGLSREKRRIARLGYRYYCALKVSFGLESLQRGRIKEAALQFARAFASYLHYARAILLPAPALLAPSHRPLASK